MGRLLHRPMLEKRRKSRTVCAAGKHGKKADGNKNIFISSKKGKEGFEIGVSGVRGKGEKK